MSEQMMKWPDLNQFGLALGVEVDEESRRLCLCISEMSRFQAHISPAIIGALKALDFDMPDRFSQDKRFYSTRPSVKIVDLQTVFPGFSSRDIKMLPAAQVLLRPEAAASTIESMTFSEWEGEVTRLLEEKLEIPTSDAQGIVEAQPFVMQQAWGEGISPTEAAGRVDKASAVVEPRKIEVADLESSRDKFFYKVEDPGPTFQKILAQAKAGNLSSEKRKNKKSEELSEKIKDVGEKIGGARKDLAGRRLMLEDLEQMTEFEKKELVKKDKVFPPFDYRAMKEGGIEPAVAIFLKKMRDVLPVHAEKNRVEVSWDMRPGGRLYADVKYSPEIFIQALDKMYSAVADVKTVDELKSKMDDLKAFCRLRSSPDLNELRKDHVEWEEHPRLKEYMEATTFCSAIGRKAVDLIYSADYYIRAAERISEKNGWAAVIKPKGARTEKTDSDQIPERPHLAKIERVGPVFRQKDLSAEELMNHFGARAIEFGNWLPQDERQMVINHAFEAISDLAEVLGVPPADVGLGGVGLAFGARGRGGKGGIMAHYEPGRTVVNLTRISGAGSLAHEFAHAIDHYLGKIVSGKDCMLSAIYQDRYKFDQKSGDLVQKFYALEQAISSKPATVGSGLVMANENLEKYTRWAKSWVSAARLNKITDPEKIRQFEAAAQRIIDQLKNGELPVVNGSEEAKSLIAMRYITEQLASQAAKISAKNYKGLMANLRAIETCRDQAMDYKDKDPAALDAGRIVKSDFLHNAEKLDSKRSSRYWAKTEELFARSFECWVADTLASQGRRSDYLVHGVEEARYVDSKYRGNPYPAGEERKRINQAMGEFVAEAGRFLNSLREENKQEKKKTISLAVGM